MNLTKFWSWLQTVREIFWNKLFELSLEPLLNGLNFFFSWQDFQPVHRRYLWYRLRTGQSTLESLWRWWFRYELNLCFVESSYRSWKTWKAIKFKNFAVFFFYLCILCPWRTKNSQRHKIIHDIMRHASFCRMQRMIEQLEDLLVEHPVVWFLRLLFKVAYFLCFKYIEGLYIIS